MGFSAADEQYMRRALVLAEQAAAQGEVPVGAVLVCRGEIAGEGYNQREQGRDATLHAEMIAIRSACAKLGGWRLPGAVLYVTLEPCPMCAGAILAARVDLVVYGAADSKGGACGSVLDVTGSGALNYRSRVVGGLLAEESSALLKKFFSRRRQDKQNK